MVLHPQQGIVVLEVKGSANIEQVELITNRGNVLTYNPFVQVRAQGRLVV